MHFAAVVLLFPVVFAAISSTWLGLYAWRWRKRGGVRFFAFFWLWITILTVGYLLESISLTLEQKVFWDAVQWLPYTLFGVTLLAFAVYYTDRQQHFPPLVRALVLLPLGVFIPLIITFPLHDLIYDTVELVQTEYFVVLTYHFTPLSVVIIVYNAGCLLAALLLLAERLHASTHVGKVQIAYLFMSFLLPILVTLIPSALDWTVLGLRDLTPFGFALANVLLIIAVIRERLFQVMPVARDLFIESLNEIVLVVDADGRVMDHNRGFARSVSAEVLIGEPAERVAPFWSALMRNRGEGSLPIFQFQGDVQFTADERSYTFNVFTNPVYQPSGTPTGMIVIARDVTSERAAEASLRERERLHHELETQRLLIASQNLLVRRIAHEFRTPLSIIRLNHDLLWNYSERLSPERRNEKLTLINRQIDLMDAILEQLHNVLMNREAVIVQPMHVRLSDIIDEVTLDVSAIFRTERTIKRTIAPEVEIARVDPDLLRLWLSNLIGNACKYSPTHAPVELSAYADEGALVLEVRDYGIGIPEQALPYVFEPFYRAPNVIAEPGMGLGLGLVRDTVQAHGGAIVIRSCPSGPGTCATITLPGAAIAQQTT